ncbi:MAG: thrombospondin type 3 repeat-containing protein [Candidatus Thermoplasmatota archaeon]|nr:thrombospondin type 3 repeat-containing protein [Candidatus Thermoplasmatota archaeon]
MRVWLVTIVFLCMAMAPLVNNSTQLEELSESIQQSPPLQTSISSNSGWITGGEEITITGSGFSDLDDTNVTYDGINHQWTKTTADFGNEAGHENAIAIDSNGHVHIVHASGDGYAFTHSVYDGTSWTPSGIKNCEGSYCWGTDMAIDENDELHVAYSTNTNKVVYMRYDGTTWNSTQISSSAKVGPVGIALDSNNHPHISFTASGMHCGNGLKLASFDGTGWTTNSIDSGSNKGCDSALLIDGNDKAYISYLDRSQSKLKFATNKSGSWADYTPDSGGFSTGYPGSDTSLAIDHQGRFHIAHFDSHEDYEDLRYSVGVPNGAWTTTVVDSSGDTGRDPSIAIDAAGDPHIVYRSWSGWKFKYATLNPSSPSWQVSTIESVPGSIGDGTGESNSIIIDDGGTIHVAYSDETNGVLRYATKPTGVSVTNEVTVKFGQFGSVTGDVIDDSTIRLTTPAVASAGTVTVSLIDHQGIEHQLSSTFEFIDQNDLDGDGISNANDDCQEVAGNSTQDVIGCPDDDGDGYSNSGDAFPSDANEWMDSDGDGVGDNSDAFPNDTSETTDSDGDGVGDNSDAFPNDANETTDSDGDGIGDNSDAFPMNMLEWEDLDGNQIPDNSEASKVNITSSSEDMRIYPSNIYANNLTLTVEAITSEGFTMVEIESTPDILPNTGGLPYGLSGGDIQIINLEAFQLMQILPGSFFSGEYISDMEPYVYFTVHVTGMPHGCIGEQQYWDAEQQASCPTKIENHRTDFYANFTMMLWNGDDDNDGVPNSWDLYPLDPSESQDSDGDGVGDNSDAFPNDGNRSADADRDGVDDTMDDCPNSSATDVVDENGCLVETDSDGDGVEDVYDQCPDVDATELDLNGDGCLDDTDGDGILDSVDECPETELEQSVSEDGCSEAQLMSLDSDGDGVSDFDDTCPNTPEGSTVDVNGCVIEPTQETEEDEEATSAFESFFSGEGDTVTTTLGISAILLALFTLLQTNAAAALLPDAFRWVQVLRKNSKLTKEERNELTYLQSIVQAYYDNPQELADELNQLKGDLTGRYTNNEIKKQTREKLFTLIEDLLASSPRELYQIAHNDAYFGLAGSIDSEDRTKLLQEKLAMSEQSGPSQEILTQDSIQPPIDLVGSVNDDGYEWVEWPQGSGSWWYRTAHSNHTWMKWD